jgi:hypothetical protein
VTKDTARDQGHCAAAGLKSTVSTGSTALETYGDKERSMKISLKRPQLNRRWLMLGGAVFLGIVATGMSQKVLHDRMAQLDVQVRAVNRMVWAVAARRDLACGTQIQPVVVLTRAVGVAIGLWSSQLSGTHCLHATQLMKSGL